MSLVTRFPRVFRQNVVARGRPYYSGGRVRLRSTDGSTVTASVMGSERYRVVLDRVGAVLFVSCTCPYIESYGEPCKHVVATILAAEERELDAVTGRVASIELDDWDEEDYDDEEDWEGDEPAGPTRGRARARAPARAEKQPGWRDYLAAMKAQAGAAARPEAGRSRKQRIVYVLDLDRTLDGQGVALEVAVQSLKANGEWGALRVQGMAISSIPQLPDPVDRQIMSILSGGKSDDQSRYYSYYSPYYGALSTSGRYRLTQPLALTVVPLVCRSGRCLLRGAGVSTEPSPLEWDDGPAWQLWLELRRRAPGGAYELTGSLRRDGERRPLSEPLALASGGLVLDRGRMAALDDRGAFAWVPLLRARGSLPVPAGEVDLLLGELFAMPAVPRLDLPDELRFEETAVRPVPRLLVKAPPKGSYAPDRLSAELSFLYDHVAVPEERPGDTVADVERRKLIARDAEAEAEAAARLASLGLKQSRYSPEPARELAARKLPSVARALLAEGWHVEAEGKLYRQPGEVRVEVTSGIDWFDLHGTVEYGETTASLPALLAALRRGEQTVQLDDGTFGVLPEEWLRKYGTLAALGEADGEHLRFRRAQVGLLDALLAAQPEARVDRVFARARDELKRFEGVAPADAPPGFAGELREYQRDGLGWLQFLQRFGFGGCLADDMGLGKTVQVLALLEGRRAGRPGRPSKSSPALPSLVVVPKSLVFNWKLEAERFTPRLRVLDHTGQGRATSAEAFGGADLVVTTYGTLRKDAKLFAGAEFDYVVLDEAQAIKNPDTASAKAARLLRGRHRLALSGTPVENHLGELWSIFEFLNPGFLGTLSAFNLFGAGARAAEPETRDLLSRALRPFILRRTKEQVAKDLPAKLEQTIYCEMEPGQRKLYDQLLRHYRESLLGLVERDGIKRSKIQILEALLRLRQAACHPGLIDKKRVGEPSAKLDVLLPQLSEVVDEGHKTLVFSQFTSMLAIVRERLDREGVSYEYLDGRTRDRAARVERFQTDPDCRLFLISLKAGGLGLNLTAADYVFLLDPWWNPAVEAQAIDRAHRIGQTRNVFAYRLIAKETVEEKVLALQETKRELADAIITADNSLIRNLSGEDLTLLLS